MGNTCKLQLSHHWRRCCMEEYVYQKSTLDKDYFWSHTVVRPVSPAHTHQISCYFICAGSISGGLPVQVSQAWASWLRRGSGASASPSPARSARPSWPPSWPPSCSPPGVSSGRPPPRWPGQTGPSARTSQSRWATPGAGSSDSRSSQPCIPLVCPSQRRHSKEHQWRHY